jgi:hypothetical protein
VTKDRSGDLQRDPGESQSVDDQLKEPMKYRYMRLGLPAGLGLFTFAAAYLAGGINPPLALFLIVFVFLIAESTALALLTAHSVEVLEEGLVGAVPLGNVRIPWNTISLLESVDRRDLAIPRRFVRVVGRDQLFVFDSVDRFDELLGRVAKAAGQPIFPMPLWKRILVLQWGV